MMMSLMPLAQTPWDKKHSQSQRKHSESVRGMIESIAPWQHKSTRGKLAHLRGKVNSGEVQVILDAGDQANLGLYEGAKIIRG